MADTVEERRSVIDALNVSVSVQGVDDELGVGLGFLVANAGFTVLLVPEPDLGHRPAIRGMDGDFVLGAVAAEAGMMG